MTAAAQTSGGGVTAESATTTRPAPRLAHYQLNGPALTFQVLGVPVGQGRITTYGPRMSVHSNAKTLLPWREQVQHAAEAAIGDAFAFASSDFPLVGVPVGLYCCFTMPKPKSAPKTRRTFPITRPDASHLVRAVEDALTAAGVWKDDSQVVTCTQEKVYPGEHIQALHVPGVIVRVYTVGGAA